MLISVVICTRDRAESLARTLQSIVAAARSINVEWELIVVDNGSSNATSMAVEQFRSTLPVTVVRAPIPGLSRARNVGLGHAKGDYILWTDDDVLVDEGWLAAYANAFMSNPHSSIFGGRAVPRYLPPVQAWFVDQEKPLRSLLAVRDCPEWSEIEPHRVPYGLNFAIRRKEQLTQPYDPDLGVAPGRRQGGEETAVIRQLLARGCRGSWVWGATVYHLIPPERQTVQYISDFYEAHGRSFPVLNRRIRRLVPLAICLGAGILAFNRVKLYLAEKYRIGSLVPTLIQYARIKGTMATLRQSGRLIS